MTDDDDDVLSDSAPETPITPVEEDDGDDTLAPSAVVQDTRQSSDEIEYPDEQLDFRGEPIEHLANLIQDQEASIGAQQLDINTRTIGSWENLICRSLFEPKYEEMRIQEALAAAIIADKEKPTDRLRNDAGKIVFRTSRIDESINEGETKVFVGDAARLAFEDSEEGSGGYRVLLYNSGISLDIVVPTGTNIQTMLSNCILADRELGSGSGAHYFAYNDLMYKNQIIDFIRPLIINSSFVDWKKRDRLWSVIKLPDLGPLVATLAALCYKDGYDDFAIRCTRPHQKDKADCHHVERLTVDIFKMIVTRFSVLSESSVKHMTAARSGTVKHTVSQIAKYQSELGLEGERISFGNVTFVMRVPTLAEHVEAGREFLNDIINEIAADNNEARYEQFGLRYVRTLLPWIATVEKTRVAKNGSTNVAVTAERDVIVRELEKLDDKDPDGKVRDALRYYVNKTQLTYVGYPITPCPQCGYLDDTPSGMRTIDPFNAFFTLAFQFLRPKPSTDQTA